MRSPSQRPRAPQFRMARPPVQSVREEVEFRAVERVNACNAWRKVIEHDETFLASLQGQAAYEEMRLLLLSVLQETSARATSHLQMLATPRPQ